MSMIIFLMLVYERQNWSNLKESGALAFFVFMSRNLIKSLAIHDERKMPFRTPLRSWWPIRRKMPQASGSAPGMRSIPFISPSTSGARAKNKPAPCYAITIWLPVAIIQRFVEAVLGWRVHSRTLTYTIKESYGTNEQEAGETSTCLLFVC